MRLFVALLPPDEVVEELRTSTAALRQVAPELRWTRPEQWHLSLVFLGEVGAPAVAPLSIRLGRAAARHRPLSLSLGGGGRFGQRVLWTRVHGDRQGLCGLADSVRAAARRCSLPVEQRPYHPHLTLARVDTRTSDRSSPDLQALVERFASGEGRRWVASRVYLVRSRLGAGPNGSALHEPIADWPLGGQRSGPSPADPAC